MSAPISDLDPLAILEAIGVGDVRSARRVATGLGGAALFRVERAADVRALRVYQPGADAGAARERAAMDAARSAGVPVPAIETAAEWSGRPVALIEWCDGVTMLDEVARRPWRAFAAGRRFGRVQARLHAAPPPTAPELWERDWMTLFGDVDPRVRARLTAVPGRPALLHLDLHPYNVLVAGGRITGVVDWENAAIGDPRADLARTWSVLRLAPMPPDAKRPGVGLVRRAIEAGWRRGYRETAGWPEGMGLFRAWAAEAMVADLAPKIGRPGVWVRDEDLAPIRRVAAELRRRSGFDD